MHKRLNSKLLFIFLLILLLNGSITAKSKDIERIAVILEPVIIKQATSTDDYADFTTSISNHIRYYLSYKGYDCKIYSNADSVFDMAKFTENFAGIITITPEFEYTNKQMMIEDAKRRRKFADIKGYLTCRFGYRWNKLNSNDSVSILHGEVVEHSEVNWFEFDHDPVSSQLISYLRSTPEPKEYVLQRAIEKLFSGLPKKETNRSFGDRFISSMFFIDSSFVKHTQSDWENKLHLLTTTASQSLFDQFGFGLQIGNVDMISLSSENGYTMMTLFRALKKHNLQVDERLSIYLLNKNNRVDYFTSNTYDNIGLAEIGRKQIILNELPFPKKNETIWQSFYNSLTLIHEIGHAFGALHVSDKNSVMNHTTNWIASDRFDPFNKQIITDALKGELQFNNKLAYLTYVGDLLLQSDYHLVDFPPFFYSFFKDKSDSSLFRAFKSNRSFKPIILAVSGFGYLQNGFLKNAATDLKKAIKLLPNQASLYYYLSQCLTGKDAKDALHKAKQLGYFNAELKDKKRQ